MSETYGASGWELNFADQKKVADWQFALGINLVCQHLFYTPSKVIERGTSPCPLRIISRGGIITEYWGII